MLKDCVHEDQVQRPAPTRIQAHRPSVCSPGEHVCHASQPRNQSAAEFVSLGTWQMRHATAKVLSTAA